MSKRIVRPQVPAPITARHTTGPWRIFMTKGKPPFYVIGIGRENGEGITDGNVGLGIWDADSPEALANAHLIAAAPDLLTVAIAIRSFLEQGIKERAFSNFGRAVARHLLVETNAAIAKAKP